MEYRQLGKSGIRVSAVAFGAWAIGGPGQWGWGSVDDNQSVAAIRRALELGVNFIDTADAYGRGHSEEIIAKAIGNQRKDVVIATKAGIVVDDQGNEVGVSGRRDYILHACEASLRRLQTDTIDLYQVHSPDEKTPLEETMGALSDLLQQGKVRTVGVSNYPLAMLEESARLIELTSLQPPYSLFNRGIEADLLPWCKQHSLTVLAYAPMAHGLLSGKYTAGMKFAEGDWRARDEHFQGEKFERNLRVVERLRRIAAESGRTVAQLAIAWVLSQSDNLIALAGARRAEQIEETAKAADWILSRQDIQRIEEATADAVPVLV